MSKYLEDRDRVFPAVVEEKMVPPHPMLVLGFGLLKSYSDVYLFVNTAEVSAEDIGFRS
jgi:hypothetical protein